MADRRISSQLRYMTVRILTSRDSSEKWSGAGTGFRYMFHNGERSAPFIITNKHVLNGAATTGLNFHVTTDNNESPLPGPGRLVTFTSGDNLVIRHPSPDVDLAAIALRPIAEAAFQQQGWAPYIKCLDKSNLPSQAMLDDLSALEDVVMVGYPTGLIDGSNNFPIVRRGITSTPYKENYQGKKEFLADIPVYGGSSGSPVFLLNEGSWMTPGGLVMGTRFALIGVLYAGHTETVSGNIVSEPVPTNLAPVAKVTHMINLGICIKSSLIEDMLKQIPT